MDLFLSCHLKNSRMCKWALCALSFLITNTVFSQNKALPAEAKSFISKEYEMLDYITGDINNDKRQDALLVLKQKGEDSADTDLKRPLLVLIRQTNGQLMKVVQNDSAILCLHCGGIFGDPYESIDTTKNGFIINFYGGSSWRWSCNYTFTFNPVKKNWLLTLQEESSYHNTEIDKTQKDITIEKEELGNISIESFNANFNSTETKWKVASDKTFFYNNPKIGSKPRKGYLLKGDIVSSYRQFKNFVEVYFQNKKAQSSSGFILKKDLVKIE
jgi:hypothetical protein